MRLNEIKRIGIYILFLLAGQAVFGQSDFYFNIGPDFAVDTITEETGDGTTQESLYSMGITSEFILIGSRSQLGIYAGSSFRVFIPQPEMPDHVVIPLSLIADLLIGPALHLELSETIFTLLSLGPSASYYVHGNTMGMILGLGAKAGLGWQINEAIGISVGLSFSAGFSLLSPLAPGENNYTMTTFKPHVLLVTTPFRHRGN